MELHAIKLLIYQKKMTKEQFFDWLSGYFDICEPDRVGIVETQTIKDHINLVRGVVPTVMAEQVDKFISGPPPINFLSSDSETRANFSSPQIKKSSGGRVRPTIEAPPPPVKVFPQDYPALLNKNSVEFEGFLKGTLPTTIGGIAPSITSC